VWDLERERGGQKCGWQTMILVIATSEYGSTIWDNISTKIADLSPHCHISLILKCQSTTILILLLLIGSSKHLLSFLFIWPSLEGRQHVFNLLDGKCSHPFWVDVRWW
jgi:hypothetical protein